VKISELIERLTAIRGRCEDCDVLIEVGPSVRINIAGAVVGQNEKTGNTPCALLMLGDAEGGKAM
jgi:hypothetical protein